ncbi:Plant calmodulin-binding protein-related [Raphanus sativus]|uniref:Calmodulin binding protein PICBP n=1 Tax=Raphanus sativus TaxID=3726 RepID=A0A6J0MN99_RAPSA|nr:calmodulin binding protein PICBP [Raphanus sativus]KAJ4906852.1 Plant calmodulin-binding protein-related [Raphanus sativus]
MVQSKTTCQAIKSYNLQPETRFGQEHLKNLGPEMMLMKRTKPKRKLKDTSVSQPGKTQPPPNKHDFVVKVTGRSPNYMKGTSSSEARIEKKKIFNQKNQTSLKHDGVKKERSNNKPSSRMVKGLTKTPSFKRCTQRATCSSILKDPKFPEYLMLNHGGTDGDEVSGTSVLRVCPYTYCSLNCHLHKQHPPLKSFISSRRGSLKSQNSVQMEPSVERYVEEKKECEDANGEVDVETQISETISVGAPCSETDSDKYSDTVEMVKLSEGDDGIKESDLEEETLVKDSVKEVQETTTCEVDIDSDSAGTVRFLEGDHDINLKEDVDQSCYFNSEADDAAGDETLKDNKAEDCKEESQDQTEATKVPCNQEEDLDVTVAWTIIKCKKHVSETEDLTGFNPREPNYLPLSIDADTEKVDLKHQDMDERRNSEDWMFDYALQRAVTKLSSARKRKVALLVEAFETVKPITKQHGREPEPVLSYGKPLQTCN